MFGITSPASTIFCAFFCAAYFLILVSAARLGGLTSKVTEISNDPKIRRVKLPLGNIDGILCEREPTIIRFLGIPFAAPPVGNLRFRPPVPYSSPYPFPALNATKNPQPCGSYCAKTGIYIGTGFSSESCLFLSVWVPHSALAFNAQVPVKVYIHGGHDLMCSASDPFIDGCNYAAKTGHIQVNIQYRKGPFGHLAHPQTFLESNTTGNWAVMDQQMALNWVKTHIAYFGGDPNRILLNGHSQGGQYVELHQIAPHSVGLFKSVISQSPACVKQLTLEQAYKVTAKFLETVGCNSTDGLSEKTIDCLRKVSWERLFDAGEQMPNDLGGGMFAMCESLIWRSTFQAVVDGNVLPYHFNDALKYGNYHQVPYMVGFSSNEGNSFVYDFDNVTEKTFETIFWDIYPFADVEPVRQLYPIKYYTGLSTPFRAQAADLWTDVFFKCPIYERLSARYNTAIEPIYLYQWDVTPTCPADRQYLGAYHSSDLAPTMGIVKNINPPDGTCDFTEKEVHVSNMAVHGWKTMTEIGIPLWLNSTIPWSSWDPVSQLGTFLNVDNTATAFINLRKNCEVLQAAKESSMNALFQQGLLSKF